MIGVCRIGFAGGQQVRRNALIRSSADNPILLQRSETHPLAHVLRLRTVALRWQYQDVRALAGLESSLYALTNWEHHPRRH